jgi:internalin A
MRMLLLLSAALAGLSLAAPAATVDQVDDAVKAIKESGGRVWHDEKAVGRPVSDVDIEEPESADEVLKVVDALTTIRGLSLFRTNVTDAGLVHLRGLVHMESLDISETEITDAGLVNLRGLTRLSMLHLGRTKVKGEGLRYIAGITAIKELDLSGTKVGDRGLIHLRGLKNLENLWLTDTPVTNAGLLQLESLEPVRIVGFCI